MIDVISAIFAVSLCVGAFAAGYGYRESKDVEAYDSLLPIAVGVTLFLIGVIGLINTHIFG